MLRSSTSSNQVSATSTSKGFIVLLTFILFSFLTACSPKDTAIAPQAIESADLTTSVMSTNQGATVAIDSNATLKSIASFPIGAAFNSSVITNNPKAYQLFFSQFNSKTVHAYLNVESTQGKFNFKEPDYWVKQAQTNSIRLHGHCLIHNGSTPEWLLNFSGNTSGFEQAIKNHIQTVVGRYKGQIKSWDVVNEIFDYNTGTIRQTPFRKYYTNDAAYMEFIKRCFQWAHAADPDALLFYNDFALESYPAKLEAVIKLVNDFKSSGTPINGIGTQMHIDINTNEAGIRNSFLQLSATGLQVHVSELDISINTKNDPDMVFTSQLLTSQSAKYQAVAKLYKQVVPPALRYGITLWDFSDADTWLVAVKKCAEQPNIFDKNLNKKAAFYGLEMGLK